MSATVNTTLTITSSNLTSDVISLTLPTTLLSAVQGGITRVELATNVIAAATVLAESAQYPLGSKLWVYNPSTVTDGTERIHISLDEATSFCTLKGGDWAVIPWTGLGNAGALNIEAYGQTAAGQLLEYGIFAA